MIWVIGGNREILKSRGYTKKMKQKILKKIKKNFAKKNKKRNEI